MKIKTILTEMIQTKIKAKKQDKKPVPSINNLVAKHDFNKGGAHADKSKYNRKQKFKKDYVSESIDMYHVVVTKNKSIVKDLTVDIESVRTLLTSAARHSGMSEDSISLQIPKVINGLLENKKGSLVSTKHGVTITVEKSENSTEQPQQQSQDNSQQPSQPNV